MEEKRLTDEEVLLEYFREMGIDRSKVPDFIFQFMLKGVAVAREEEPRINCGVHYIDWMNICDDDDDFDSFYGPDYFK